jgi:thioredoxin 1
MTWYVILAGGFVVFLVAYFVYGYFKMKNTKEVSTSDKIKILNKKNFKTAIGRGLVLVDFWAPWCAPCKMITPVMNDIAENGYNVTVAKLNIDQNQQIAKKYKIRNIPTLVLYDHGQETKRVSGVKSKKAIVKEFGLEAT